MCSLTFSFFNSKLNKGISVLHFQSIAGKKRPSLSVALTSLNIPGKSTWILKWDSHTLEFDVRLYAACNAPVGAQTAEVH